MGLMISAGSSYHWVKKISASTLGAGVLHLTMHGDSEANERQFNQAEVTVFTNDAALVERLIEAINGAANPVETEQSVAA